MVSSVLPIYCTSVTVLLLPALPVPLFPRAIFRPSTYFCCLPPCFSSVASVRLIHPFRIHVHLRRSRQFRRNILISVTFSFSSSIFFIAHFFSFPIHQCGSVLHSVVYFCRVLHQLHGSEKKLITRIILNQKGMTGRAGEGGGGGRFLSRSPSRTPSMDSPRDALLT